MSTISASTTSTTAYKVTADTTGTLVLQTGSSPTTAMTIDGSQNVGIGTSSPSQKLAVTGTSGSLGGVAAVAAFNTGTTGDGVIGVGSTDGRLDFGFQGGLGWIATGGNYGLRFLTNSGERARIDSSGNLLVGTTSTINTGTKSITVQGSGGGVLSLSRTDLDGTSRTMAGFYTNTTAVGAINCTTTATSYATSSDYRLKENIAPMTGALDKVAALKPCTYTWKADGSDGQGFIAHELQAVVPDAVTGEKDAVDAEGNPVYQGIDTSFLVATLTAAIQELKAELDAVKAQLKG